MKAQELCTPNEESQIRSAPSSPGPRITEGMSLPYPTVPSSTPFETDSSTLKSFLGVLVTKLEGWEIGVDAEHQPRTRKRESPKSRVPSPPVSRLSTEVIQRVRSTVAEKQSLSPRVIASYDVPKAAELS